ncbi:MFS transporter [Streptomyces sp. CSDS2]|uniref:MFS transporter n=1 Tax=Streptomyces sp. CSDS2 TaxID=3055051 RepID=UPI0025AFAFA9|nr:MFS transporter [Streptomyces sp. CSDS2]MDN3263502.1 MFS transporter [Streptomyces sp. CSDS2]
MTTTQHTDAATTAGRGIGGAELVRLLALAAGFVMATLDATVVNVAGPGIQSRLDMDLSALVWVVDGYTLTFASLLLLAGSLADRYGAKTLYAWGMTVFVVASLACGTAPNGIVLVVARLVQGAGAALFMPASLGLLVATFPEPGRRARMLGIWTAIVSTASGLGPVVGGVLVDTLGWRSIFWLNLPVGVVGFVLTTRLITGPRPARGAVAPLGHLLGIAALALLCFTLVQGPEYGWGSAAIVGTAVGCLLCAVLFVVRERTSAAPVMPRRLLRHPAFAAANVIGFLLNFGLFGGAFMLGLFLQQVRGASPFTAGLQLLPMMIVILMGNLLFARIAARAGTRRPLIVALAVAGTAAALLGTVSPGTPYWLLAVGMAVVNFCVGVVVPAMTAASMEAAGREHAGLAGATLNANRQVGALVGVAVMGTVTTALDDRYQGAALCFLAMGLVYLLSGALAWRYVRAGRAGA